MAPDAGMMRCRFETESGVLEKVDHPDICTNAYFQLDRPLALTGQEFDLTNGHWSLVEFDGGEEQLRPLNGRWKPHG